VRVLISYRRGDSRYAGRLYRELVASLGETNVFIDAVELLPDSDSRASTKAAVNAADAVVVVIGPAWLAAADPRGRRELHGGDDLVHLEVGTAFRRNKQIVPALVGGVGMPEAAELPDDLVELADLDAPVLDDVNWSSGVDRLISVLGGESRPGDEAAPR
jgi:TIR domain